MAGLCGANGINSNTHIAICTIFETHGQESAEAISRWIWLSVVRAPIAPTDEVGNILACYHIEELGSGRQPEFIHG